MKLASPLFAPSLGPTCAYSHPPLFTPHTPCMHTAFVVGAPAFSCFPPLSSLLNSYVSSCSPELCARAAASVRKLSGSDMFRPLVLAFISLNPFFNTLCVAVPPPGHEDSPWFVGCVNASDSSVFGLYTSRAGRDLDPVGCSARCLDEG